MTIIVLGGLNEEDFRRSIQNRLREGKAGSVIKRLRTLIAPYAGADKLLPERFVTIEPGDLFLSGWDALGDALRRHDRPGRPVTALSIAFGWPGEEVPIPDGQGNLSPCIETSFYNDDSFPFSHSSREDLLEGYSFEGCTWGGDSEPSDAFLTVGGIDDLNGALALLETALLDSEEPDEDGLCAGSLGACLLSALLIQAVTERIEQGGLPRPLCVTAGSNGVYPYFDVPVAGMSAEVVKANEAVEDTVPTAQDVPVPRYSSLLLTGIPRAKKRAVLVLQETDDELAVRIAGLRNLHHPERLEPEIEPEAEAEPPTPTVPPEMRPAAPGSDAPLSDAPVPEITITEEPEPDFAPDTGGLLLARKPPKHSSDFRDMLSPRDPDLQQRLQSLMAEHAPSVAEPVWSEPTVTDDQPEPDWSEGPGWVGEDIAAVAPAEPEADWFEEPPAESWGTRALAKVTGWLTPWR